MTTSVLNSAGKAMILRAALGNSAIVVPATILVGDGGGAGYALNPDIPPSGLVRQVDAFPVGSSQVTPAGKWVIETDVPVDRGGYTIREWAVQDASGEIIQVNITPATEVKSGGVTIRLKSVHNLVNGVGEVGDDRLTMDEVLAAIGANMARMTESGAATILGSGTGGAGEAEVIVDLGYAYDWNSGNSWVRFNVTYAFGTTNDFKIDVSKEYLDAGRVRFYISKTMPDGDDVIVNYEVFRNGGIPQPPPPPPPPEVDPHTNIDPSHFANVFSVASPAPVYAKPATALGGYLFATDAGRLVKVDQAGGELFNVAIGPSSAAPVVEGDHVFVGDRDGAITALDVATGAQVWAYSRTTEFVNSGFFYDDRIYVAGYDGFLVALNASTGVMEWEFNVGGAIEGAPVVSGGRVFCASTSGALVAVNAQTGAEIWRQNGFGVITAPPLAADLDGDSSVEVTVFDHGGIVRRFAPDTGALLSSFEVGGAIDLAPALIDVGDLVITTVGGSVCRVGYDGAIKWSKVVGSGPVAGVVDSMVFVGSEDRGIQVMDENGGAIGSLYPNGGVYGLLLRKVNEKIELSATSSSSDAGVGELTMWRQT